MRFEPSAIALLVCAVSMPGLGRAGEPANRSARDKQLELALQYDFFLVEDARIIDSSGQKHHGTLQGGEVSEGKRKQALKLNGTGQVSISPLPESLNPSSRALTVGALCRPAAGDGVVAALGDKTNGFSLYLKDGRPQFAVRAGGELFKVSHDEAVALNQWTHLMGVIDSRGEVSLLVNGWPVAHIKGRVIPQRPAKSFAVGADTGSPVGDDVPAARWQGLLEDVRLYWGVVDRTEHRDLLQDWADLPGCGCRK